jgi:hypothetical protein
MELPYTDDRSLAPSYRYDAVTATQRAEHPSQGRRLDVRVLANCLRASMEPEAIRMGELFVGQGGRLTIQKTLPAEDMMRLVSRWGYTDMLLDFKYSKA